MLAVACPEAKVAMAVVTTASPVTTAPGPMSKLAPASSPTKTNRIAVPADGS